MFAPRAFGSVGHLNPPEPGFVGVLGAGHEGPVALAIKLYNLSICQNWVLDCGRITIVAQVLRWIPVRLPAHDSAQYDFLYLTYDNLGIAVKINGVFGKITLLIDLQNDLPVKVIATTAIIKYIYHSTCGVLGHRYYPAWQVGQFYHLTVLVQKNKRAVVGITNARVDDIELAVSIQIDG